MLKKIVFTTSTIVIITGVALTASLLEEPSRSDIPSSVKVSAPEKESFANHTNSSLDPAELSNTEEAKVDPYLKRKMDPDLNPYLDPDRLRSVGQIGTIHGNFSRAEKQTIFNEKEIAQELRQIGPDTKQLILLPRYTKCPRSDM
ncbi:hypothetical protein [Paenibacillus sp.]|jgi:hypothetical protein|uniref:hypothetical protein n=1 Tax=Paenibacillus sp. TaxID=58172 RepID=UPI00281A06E1|nr:hypothetical protein [Paenibacillus sp.]MDR0270439.1 hypothetical protein [Paenibacillus sp.]